MGGDVEILYFISIMINRLDSNFKRGSIVKSLAIASKHRYIESFTKLIHKYLEEYIADI